MHASNWRTLLRGVAGDLAGSWRQLTAVHLVYGAVAATALTPMTSLLLRWFVSVSGNTVLSDVDIALFLVRPLGVLAAVIVGSLSLTILALEMAALMRIGFGASSGQPVSYRDALRFTFRKAPGVLRVSAEIVGRSLLLAAPFLAGCGVVYVVLLAGNDINFYLVHKPPIFWVAAGLMAALLTGMLLVLLRAGSGWFFSLPFLLFENVPARDALRSSTQLVAGHRRLIVQWLVAWLLASAAFSALATALVAAVGRAIVPQFAASLAPLVLVLGGVVILAAIANYLVSLANSAAFGLLVVRLFRAAGRGAEFDPRAAAPPASGRRRFNWNVTGRGLMWGLLTAAVAAMAVGGTVLDGIRLEDTTEIVAHRGASAAAPENTLAAVRRAIDDGADWVEIDVQETADGHVVVFHDSDFKRLAATNLKIWEASLDQLQELDVGSWFAPEFAAERVPTLGEVLDLCRGKINVLIELKYYGHDERLEERVIEIVESREMANDAVFMSLEQTAVQRLRALRPGWKVGLLTSVAVGDVTRLDLDFLALNARTITASLVELAQRRGKQVLVWTVNDAVNMSRMMSYGVSGIITDEPALAVQVIEQRSSLSPPERLLLALAELFGIEPQYGKQ